MKAMNILAASALLVASPSFAQFSDTGQTNAEVERTDPRIVGWASNVIDFDRGLQDYQNPGLGDVTFGNPSDLLGPSGSPFSLGDGGFITVELDIPAVDGAGVDFAVFENAFQFGGSTFGELAFIEVSSNGTDFARMPALSRIGAPLGSFDAVDPNLVYNLAGQFVGGTGIDLADLVRANDPMVLAGTVDLTMIRFVRLVDVIGDYLGASSVDYLGRAVSDPYPTAFASGGCDLTGVAVLNGIGAVKTESTSFGGLKSQF